jgi:hypothetical protein
MAVVPPYFHGFAVSAFDARLVTLAFSTAVVSALAGAVAPSLSLRRFDLLSVLQRGSARLGSGRLRGGRFLLGTQAALAIVLVAGAAVTVRSFFGLLTEELGFDPNHLYRLQVNHGSQPTGPVHSPERVRGVEEIVRAHPGVVSAAAATQLPLPLVASQVSPFLRSRGIDGNQFGVSAGLFATLATPLAAGREFTGDEVREVRPVALINRAAAAALWPDTALERVIGRSIDEAGSERVIVGVIGVITGIPGRRAMPAILVPVTEPGARRYSSALFVAIRTSPGVSPDFSAIDLALDQRFGPSTVRVMSILDARLALLDRPRFQAALFGALAGIALMLGAVGLYAVASLEVSRRRFEMGVRLALGASPRALALVLAREALKPTLGGILVGTICALWCARFLQAYLFGVDARDPVTLALVAAVIVSSAVAAVWLPARRASALDPVKTLRSA